MLTQEEEKNIYTHIYTIQQAVQTQSYEEYKVFFENYRRYLESLLTRYSNNVMLICQVSAVYMELGYKKHDVIKPLENGLAVCSESGESGRIYSNLAWYKFEHGEEAIPLLKKAISLSKDGGAPETCNALAVLLAEYTNESKLAADLFEKIIGLNSLFLYNYAVFLYKVKKYDEAKNTFKKLQELTPDDLNVDYGYAACCYFVGDSDAALEIIKIMMQKDDWQDYIDAGVLADLAYLCGNFTLYNKLYGEDQFEYYIDDSWVGKYLYALKQQERIADMEKHYNQFVAEVELQIVNLENDEVDENYSVIDRDTNVRERIHELNQIKESYRKIIEENYQPIPKITLYFHYGCYLIDCPRHQNIDKEIQAYGIK